MIHVAIYTILLIWALFVFYAAVMSLQRARDSGQVRWPMMIVGYPALYVGLTLDLLTNVVVCSVLFVEFPRELLVTSRLSRHSKSADWRGTVARWICSNLLDPLDPSGCHCK